MLIKTNYHAPECFSPRAARGLHVDDHVLFFFAVASGDQGMLVKGCCGAILGRHMCHTRRHRRWLFFLQRAVFVWVSLFCLFVLVGRLLCGY
jgi:hypothetical protein